MLKTSEWSQFSQLTRLLSLTYVFVSCGYFKNKEWKQMFQKSLSHLCLWFYWNFFFLSMMILCVLEGFCECFMKIMMFNSMWEIATTNVFRQQQQFLPKKIRTRKPRVEITLNYGELKSEDYAEAHFLQWWLSTYVWRIILHSGH